MVLPTSELDKISFFLMSGEYAPFKSVSEIDELTPAQRKFFIESLSELYEKQKEEMDKAKAKQRSARKR